MVIFDPQLTFWICVLLEFICGVLLGDVVTLFDGACLAVVNEVKGHLGVQRIFDLCGIKIFSPIVGVLIDYYSIGNC